MKKQIFDLRHINTAPIIIYNWFKKLGFTAIFPNDNNPLIIDNNLGIPVSGSIAAGFVLGITRRD
jgi:hypothetical protein